ncbi:MAG: YhbY family RNA-binding protein [Verrucomicrobiae bacterium]|jgi:RNA-binding protein|nr:YhbY family RNA-binding protein [Verrucomicrobiae bacterium]
MPIELTQRQKRQLRAVAQRLDAHTHIGRKGLTETFIAGVAELLAAHELIKIRFEEFKDRKDELSAEVALRTDSVYVVRVGHVAVFYRPQPDPAKRKVKLD